MGVSTDTRVAQQVSVGRAILVVSASSLLFHSGVGFKRLFPKEAASRASLSYIYSLVPTY